MRGARSSSSSFQQAVLERDDVALVVQHQQQQQQQRSQQSQHFHLPCQRQHWQRVTKRPAPAAAHTGATADWQRSPSPPGSSVDWGDAPAAPWGAGGRADHGSLEPAVSACDVIDALAARASSAGAGPAPRMPTDRPAGGWTMKQHLEGWRVAPGDRQARTPEGSALLRLSGGTDASAAAAAACMLLRRERHVVVSAAGEVGVLKALEVLALVCSEQQRRCKPSSVPGGGSDQGQQQRQPRPRGDWLSVSVQRRRGTLSMWQGGAALYRLTMDLVPEDEMEESLQDASGSVGQAPTPSGGAGGSNSSGGGARSASNPGKCCSSAAGGFASAGGGAPRGQPVPCNGHMPMALSDAAAAHWVHGRSSGNHRSHSSSGSNDSNGSGSSSRGAGGGPPPASANVGGTSAAGEGSGRPVAATSAGGGGGGGGWRVLARELWRSPPLAAAGNPSEIACLVDAALQGGGSARVRVQHPKHAAKALEAAVLLSRRAESRGAPPPRLLCRRRAPAGRQVAGGRRRQGGLEVLLYEWPAT